MKIGVAILFLGLAFLLRLASEYIHVSITQRYIGVALAGAVLGGVGWWLRDKKQDYALVLQGASFAVMYLTTLSALKLHPLLPTGMAFVVMVLLVALMAGLAVIQNAAILAQVALIGGLAAPLLTSTGSYNYVALFSYLALLNTGVALIARFKSWRMLNLIGFTGTFGIASFWGKESYTAADFYAVEPFLLYHTVLYTGIAWLFARQQLAHAKRPSMAPADNQASLEVLWQRLIRGFNHIDVLDHTLLFGTAMAAFGLQYRMTMHWAYGPAWSALGFALFYAVAAWLVWCGGGRAWRMVTEALACLALVFVSLSVPLAFNANWTAVVWALEAALIYVFGMRQHQPITRLQALLVYGLAALNYLSTLKRVSYSTDSILQGSVFGNVLLIVSGALMIYVWRQNDAATSAKWEHNGILAVLAVVIAHMTFLPLLLLGPIGSVVCLAILAVGLAAVSCKLQEKLMIYSVAIVSGLAALIWLQYGGNYWNLAIWGVSALVAAWWLQSAPGRTEHLALADRYGWVLLVGGMIGLSYIQPDSWLPERLAAADTGIWRFLPPFALLALGARWTGWRQAARAGLAWLPMLILGLLSSSDFLVLGSDRLLAISWWAQNALSWLMAIIAAFLLHIWLLRCYKRICHTNTQPSVVLYGLYAHIVGLNLFTLLFGWWLAMNFAARYGFSSTAYALGWLLVPLAVTAAIPTNRIQNMLADNRFKQAYNGIGMLPVVIFMLSWVLRFNIVSDGSTAPLPYLPVLNPLELATLAVFYLIWRWWRQSSLQNDPLLKQALLGTMAFSAWLTLSAGVMRIWHHYADVPWQFKSLLASFGMQATLSVVWALAAIVLMVQGNRNSNRKLWFAGGALMGLVVLKLFVVELSDSGGIARIVSFIAVGILLLLVGYFSPMPPKSQDE